MAKSSWESIVWYNVDVFDLDLYNLTNISKEYR